MGPPGSDNSGNVDNLLSMMCNAADNKNNNNVDGDDDDDDAADDNDDEREERRMRSCREGEVGTTPCICCQTTRHAANSFSVLVCI